MFLPTYATIEEAWGTKVPFHEVQNPYKDATVQRAALQEQPPQPSEANIRRMITKKYRLQGLPGIKQYLTPCIIRDIRRGGSRKGRRGGPPFQEMFTDDFLYAMLGLSVLFLVVDF